MTSSKRKLKNPSMVEIKPGVCVPLHRAMAMVEAIRRDFKNVKKTDLTPAAQAFWF